MGILIYQNEKLIKDMIESFDDEPYYDHEHGRWMCRTLGDAITTMQMHEGDTIFLYDRDKQGFQTNIRVYYTSSMDKPPKYKHVKHGRLIK
jgi:hypothetical protein